MPSTVAEAHRKELQDMDEVIRKEQQVRSSTNTPLRTRSCLTSSNIS